MRDDLRGQLNTEITRKQFLQYLTGAALMVFGLNNLVNLLTGNKYQRHLQLPMTSSEGQHGFGSSRFGV